MQATMADPEAEFAKGMMNYLRQQGVMDQFAAAAGMHDPYAAGQQAVAAPGQQAAPGVQQGGYDQGAYQQQQQYMAGQPQPPGGYGMSMQPAGYAMPGMLGGYMPQAPMQQGGYGWPQNDWASWGSAAGWDQGWGGGKGGWGNKGGGKGGRGRGNGPRHDTTKTAGKLFIGGLHPETTKATLDAYCGQYGEIVDSVVMPGRGFGFLTFRESDQSNTFLSKEGGHEIDGKKVECKEAQPKTAEEAAVTDQIRSNYGYSGLLMAGGPGSKKMQNRLNPPATKLFVGGIADTSDEMFRTYWEQFGELSDCAVVRDASGKSRGFGFVTFQEQAGVEWALSNPHHSIMDRVCEVKRAVPKLDGPGPSPGAIGGGDQYPAVGGGAMPQYAQVAPGGEVTAAEGGQTQAEKFAGGKSAGSMLPGDWICTSCGNKNFARRQECNRCRTPRQDGGGGGGKGAYAGWGGGGNRYHPY